MHLLMVFLASSIHTAILTASLIAADVGTIIGARPGAVALAVTLRFGDTPGSELGGEPSPTGLTLTRGPQWNVPGSEGGVKVDMMRSTCALLSLGQGIGGSAVVSTCDGWSSGGLSAWRGSSGFESGPAPKAEGENE
jgi:hypothetical protein